MKVAIVTPMPVGSAIARVMIAAAEELYAEWQVEIWCPDLGQRFGAGVKVRDFDVATVALGHELAGFDLVVYAVGDSGWHAEVVRLARAVPGLVVLHDVSVTNLVYGMFVEKHAVDQLVRIVRRRYGRTVAADFAASAVDGTRDDWPAICQRVPLVDYVLQASLGVVVHSSWAAHAVEGLTLGETFVAPLPIPTNVFGGSNGHPGRTSRLADSMPPNAIVLATVGTVNANRKIDSLVQAIAGDDVLRDRVHLVAAGPITDAMRDAIDEEARALGLASRVHLTGAIDDDEMASLLERADICAALRDPVLEAKSASLLTQMMSGTPVLVLDHGHYSEMPEGTVVKVPPAGGVPAIAGALRALIDEPDAARQVGARGQLFVWKTHTPRAYAHAIATAAEEALATRPLLDMTHVLGARLRRVGLEADPALQRAASDTAFDLFDLG